jgi:hypothetical protein
MMLLGYFLAMLLAAHQSARVQTPTGSIEGIVKDAATNEPLYGVQVGLVPIPETAEARLSYATMTDDAGRFRISAPARKYTIRAERDGYFGPLRFGLASTYAWQGIDLAAGQRISDITMNLQPGGVLTGQMLSASGRPASGLSVVAMRLTYLNGRRVFTRVQDAKTNDLGEYRLYWVPPGEYILVGSASDSPLTLVTLSTQGAPARTFFPGTTDGAKAVPIVVKSGSETGGLNFALESLRGANIAGRIVSANSAPKPANPSPGESSFVAPPRIYLASRDTPVDESLSSFGNNVTASEAREGLFRFFGVPPGTYDLYTIVGDGGPTFVPVSGGSASIEVGAQDMSINIGVHPPVDLKGRFVVQGDGPAVDFPMVRLKPRGNAGGFGGTSPLPVKTAANGDFTIPKIILPATYSIEFDMPDGVYLADIRQGDRSIKRDAAIALRGEVPELIQVVLGRSPGSLRGRLASAGLDMTVVLVPDRSLRPNSMLYYTSRAERDNTFEIKNVAPGDYKLFAWDGVLSTAWMNNDFLQKYEDRGVPVKIGQKQITLDSPLAVLSR